MRRCLQALLLVVALGGPQEGGAQSADVPTVMAGAAGGAVSGAIVTLGWVVERANIEQKYLHEVEDIVGLIGTPLIVFPAAGVTLALIDRDLLTAVGTGAGIGTLSGAALGIGLGHVLAGGQTGRWAGGIMGAAAGLIAGAVYYGIDGLSEADSATPSASAARVPVGISFRF